MLTRAILELYSKQSGLLSPSSLEKGEKQTKVHWRIPCFVLSQLPIEKNSSSLTGMCPEKYWQATTTREDLTALTISQKAKSFLRPILEATPVEVPIAFLSHLSSPDSDTLFKKLKDLGSAKFNPATENICSLEICWGRWQKEQAASLVPDKPFTESDNSHCSVWKKRWDTSHEGYHRAQKLYKYWKLLWATGAQPVWVNVSMSHFFHPRRRESTNFWCSHRISRCTILSS